MARLLEAMENPESTWEVQRRRAMQDRIEAARPSGSNALPCVARYQKGAGCYFLRARMTSNAPPTRATAAIADPTDDGSISGVWPVPAMQQPAAPNINSNIPKVLCIHPSPVFPATSRSFHDG